MTTQEESSRPRWLRRWIWGIALVSACCVGAAGVLVQLLMDQSDDDDTDVVTGSGCGNNVPVDPDADLPPVAALSDVQVHNAAVIIAVGQEMEMPVKGWVVAIATAMQETNLRNLANPAYPASLQLPNDGEGYDHDSVGLFQQRPASGWGAVEELMDPATAAQKFYEKLQTVDGWEDMSLTVAAQRVQVSAYPFAYQKHEPKATEIVNTLTGGGSRVPAVNVELGDCAPPGELSAAGWIVPVEGPIWSGFRTAARPNHQGVDIGAPKGTPVVAASSGTVITSECNAFAPDGSPYSCDIDGSPAIAGCGWYVNILHADDRLTRYCHFESRPLVKEGDVVQAGQVIGHVGSSGRSSGPHLHYEVHLNGDRSAAGAVDPVAFMNNVGAALG
ncbi:M23 family metallopeptidase [Glycomyces xiaoerkulensis]|uniref:M23 family metallopeptidase n=1 Tax=Glycomyces xiaoerkulensis TaxID=2038139 RepID=UPI000C263647|nr:M23 family metallopeptidase [Glycomyces xiaoerkulensis]